MLKRRHEVYQAPKEKHPERRSSNTRNWDSINEFWLNPPKEKTAKELKRLCYDSISDATTSLTNTGTESCALFTRQPAKAFLAGLCRFLFLRLDFVFVVRKMDSLGFYGNMY